MHPQNSLIKSLYDYPCLIEELERDHYENQQTRQEVEDRIAYFSAELELEIWLDPQYKNEGMRRAAKVKQLHESEEFLSMDAELEAAKHREFSSLLRLERFKREYSVLKLKKQEAIARECH